MSLFRIAPVVLALSALTAAGPALAQDATVAVTAIVEHPALDAVRDGVRDALKAAGYEPGRNLRFEYQSAQGNPATAAQIARQFVGLKPDVIVPISTPSAQAVVSATRDVPVVFAAVTDPVGAQLVQNPDKPGGNVTGLSDFPPVEEHLKLIKEIVPNAKRIGIPYNPGDANSASLLKHVKEGAKAHGLTVVEAPAARSSDVQAAARSLVGKADVIYTMLDNMVVSALESVIAVADQNDIPVISGDTDSVKRGAVASVGFNYYDFGRQAGDVVLRILKGEKPGDIPVVSAKATDLVVNPKAAQAMGVSIPESVTARATEVVGQ